MENKFFTFIRPYLALIDTEEGIVKANDWLHVIMAMANLFFPIYIFYQGLEFHIFQLDARPVSFFLLLWLLIVFISWVSFQLWMDRRAKIKAYIEENEGFTSTAIYAHLIRTMGEWLGTWIGFIGFIGPLLVATVFSAEAQIFTMLFGDSLVSLGVLSAMLMPIAGFLLILTTRYLAEFINLFPELVRNTHKGQQ